jgi:hypothetical protein
MKSWMAVVLFCGVMPAWCQSFAADAGVDPVLGPPAAAPEYVPMTFSERARYYLVSSFGAGAVLRAAAAGGFAQATGEPQEWRVGAAAYGERVGSAFAEQVIREALEFGGSTALHEDNRYFRSTESGFLRRSKHALTSVFLARSEGGETHLGYSRLGAALGSSLISRLWQPRSQDGAGDAAVCFGLTMAAGIGWNFVQEFTPRTLARRFHGK